MRRGLDNGFLNDKSGNVVAVNLGADYVSEHECGIQEIRRDFAMTEGFGIERRRTRSCPSHLRWATGQVDVGPYNKRRKATWAGFWLSRYAREGDSPDSEVLRFYSDDQKLATGWSSSDFGAFSIVESNISRLREVFDSLCANDGVFWLGGGGVFQNAGLVIGIAGRLPADAVQAWDKADRETAKLKEDFAATGLEERLRTAGKDWFALSPRRAADGSIYVWLNPPHQQVDSFGWFTIEQLDQWARGEGPVPMTKAQKAKRGR